MGRDEAGNVLCSLASGNTCATRSICLQWHQRLRGGRSRKLKSDSYMFILQDLFHCVGPTPLFVFLWLPFGEINK